MSSHLHHGQFLFGLFSLFLKECLTVERCRERRPSAVCRRARTPSRALTIRSAEARPALGDGSGSRRSGATASCAWSAARSRPRSITFSPVSVAGATCWRTCGACAPVATPSGTGALVASGLGPPSSTVK